MSPSAFLASHNRVGWPVLLATCLAFIATALFRFLALNGFPNDQYEHLAGAQQILMGEWPTKDFFDPGMPLTYLASAGAQLLLGRTLFAEAMLTSAAFGLAAAFTLLGAYRVSRSLVVAFVAAVWCVAIYPRPYAYPKVLLCSAGPLVMWAWMAAPTLGRMVWLALFVVVAFLFRHDYGVYLGAAALATIVLTPAEEWQQVVRRVATFCGLVAVLVAPYLLFLQVYDGVVPYARSILEYGRRHAQRTQLHVEGLGWNHEVRLFYAFHALPFLALAWWVVERIRRQPIDTSVVVPLVVLAVLVNVGFLRDPLSARLADAIVPAVLLAAWVAGRGWRGSSPLLRVVAVAVAAIVVVLGTDSVWAVGNTGEQIDRTHLSQGIARTPQLLRQQTEELVSRFSHDQVPDIGLSGLVPFFEYLDRCTTSQHRLLVGAYSPEVYVYARRMFAGGQKVFIQGYYQSARDQQRIVARLRHQVVPFVLLQSDSSAQWRSSFSLVSAFVDSHFRPMADIQVSPDRSVLVLVDTDLVPLRTEEATGWPCYQRNA